MEKKFCALVLAAGVGSRMKSDIPKVCFPLGGKSLVERVVENVRGAGIDDIGVVTGYREEMVMEMLGDSVSYCHQSNQLGTLDAVKAGREYLTSRGGRVLVICGDAPMQTGEELKKFIEYVNTNALDLGFISAVLPDGASYGRVVRENGKAVRIYERKDAEKNKRLDILDIREINSGTYVFDIEKLLSVIDKIESDNAQEEFYLTDTLAAFLERGYKADAYVVENNDIVTGVNTRADLAVCERIIRERTNFALMESGVTIIDPQNTYIEESVKIASGTVIYPNCEISGASVIGKDCTIRASRIESCIIGSGTSITESVLEKSAVGNNVSIGPYTHLRPNCVIEDNVKLGNFVEIKNSHIGEGTKASHHAYVGDCDIGKNVNIGCGVIFANYDGVHKFRCNVGDNAFIGSNATLVAPVNIGAGAFIAAGSTVTIDVASEKLVIARAREVLKERKPKGSDK